MIRGFACVRVVASVSNGREEEEGRQKNGSNVDAARPSRRKDGLRQCLACTCADPCSKMMKHNFCFVCSTEYYSYQCASDFTKGLYPLFLPPPHLSSPFLFSLYQPRPSKNPTRPRADARFCPVLRRVWQAARIRARQTCASPVARAHHPQQQEHRPPSDRTPGAAPSARDRSKAIAARARFSFGS